MAGSLLLLADVEMGIQVFGGNVPCAQGAFEGSCRRQRTLPRSGPARSIFWIDALATEALLKLLGVRLVRKAEDIEAAVTAAEKVRALAQ